MNRWIAPLAACVLAADLLQPGQGRAAITTYTDASSFNAAISGRRRLDDPFSDLIFGNASLSDTLTGQGFTIVYSAPSGGLFDLTGALSTITATDNLVIDLNGGVYAVAGTFLLTDFNGNLVTLAPGQTVSATAINGIDPPSTLTSPTNGPATFFGWISTTSLQRVTSTGGGVTPNRWNTIDAMIYAGQAPLAVPAPLTLAGLAAAFGWSRRLRRRLRG
ncbi:MAG: hypothetical protein VKN13_08005 [Cyanobacteriota bacterium]|nr:hypothetical protein [Cyanobacteriota bacterium]